VTSKTSKSINIPVILGTYSELEVNLEIAGNNNSPKIDLYLF